MGILNAAPNPTIDDRSSYSSGRFVCLGGLFALFLIAPIFVSAQTGSPRSPRNPIARAECASLLQHSPYHETRLAAGSASL
jgi:hypothetical protein